MSDERFVYDMIENINSVDIQVPCIVDTKNSKKYKCNFREIIPLLNALNDENKELRQEKEHFDTFSHNWKIMYDEAKEKIEKLKKERDYWETSSKHRQRLLEECEKKTDKKLFKQKITCDSKTLTVKTDPNQRVIY